jgi:hypothetical protein
MAATNAMIKVTIGRKHEIEGTGGDTLKTARLGCSVC